MLRMFVTHLANILLLYSVNAGDIAYNVVVPPVPLANAIQPDVNEIKHLSGARNAFR